MMLQPQVLESMHWLHTCLTLRCVQANRHAGAATSTSLYQLVWAVYVRLHAHMVSMCHCVGGMAQVVLVRDMSALEQLPPELTNSNALIMTVGQSKGLEFDDVFIVNFFGDSPCTPEWRVLMTLLDKAREGTMDVPAGVTWTEVAKAAEEAGALRPLDFDERQHR